MASTPGRPKRASEVLHCGRVVAERSSEELVAPTRRQKRVLRRVLEVEPVALVGRRASQELVEHVKRALFVLQLHEPRLVESPRERLRARNTAAVAEVQLGPASVM